MEALAVEADIDSTFQAVIAAKRIVYCRIAAYLEAQQRHAGILSALIVIVAVESYPLANASGALIVVRATVEVTAVGSVACAGPPVLVRIRFTHLARIERVVLARLVDSEQACFAAPVRQLTMVAIPFLADVESALYTVVLACRTVFNCVELALECAVAAIQARVLGAFAVVVAKHGQPVADRNPQAHGQTTVSKRARIAIIARQKLVQEDQAALAGVRVAQVLLAGTVLGGIADHNRALVQNAFVVDA